MDHQILARRLDLELINKKKELSSSEYCRSHGSRCENKTYTTKTVENEVDSDTNYIWFSLNGTQKHRKETWVIVD